MIKVCPSTNPIDEEKLVPFAKDLLDLGVEYLHCDVMDGRFVENSCLSLKTIEKVRNNTNILLDVHLMVTDTFDYVKRVAKLKPNIVTIHYESVKSVKELRKIAKFLHSKEILFGVAIKPKTDVNVYCDIMDIIDLALIMSVEPGKSGQKFLPTALDKIRDFLKLDGTKDKIVEVDGGINTETYQRVVDAGANFLVMGSAFASAKDKKKLLSLIDKHYNF